MPEIYELLLSNLSRIGTTINRIDLDDTVNVEAILRGVVECTIQVVAGVSAVIYIYNDALAEFDRASRVSAEIGEPFIVDEALRTHDLGQQAIKQRRRVLSYEEAVQGLAPEQMHIDIGTEILGCFPLIVTGQVVGILFVYRREADPFSPIELLVLDNLVNQAAMAIYHTHHLRTMQLSLARKGEEIQHLRRAGLLISSRLRLEETLKAILQMALEITNAPYGIFRLLDKSGRLLVTGAVASHLSRPHLEALPLDANNVMGWVVRHQQPVRIADLRTEPWARIYYPLDANQEMRSELAVPLINANGRVEGVLNLESPKVDAFSEDDQHLLQAFAAQAVTAIQEVRLLDALQEVAEWLLTLSCQQVLEKLVALACDLLNVADSALWLLHDDKLSPAVTSDSDQHSRRWPVRCNLVDLAISQRASIIVGDDVDSERSAQADTQRCKRALVVPVMTGPDGDVLGVFCVHGIDITTEHFADSAWDTKVLTCLAHYAALALQNAARQEALHVAQERHAIAEAFAVTGDIASNLLHHINNKVGVIPVRVQCLHERCQEAIAADAYLAHNLQKIEESAVDVLTRVQESLGYLRPVRSEAVQIDACVQAALQAVYIPAELQVRCEALESLPPIRANRSSMTLVFANLLENAVQAMNGLGVITIHGVASADWVEIWVADNGPGIPQSEQEHIFDLDFSGRAAVAPGKLGFGLWWVKTLIARLDGSVTVISDGQRGTTFHLRLPREEQAS